MFSVKRILTVTLAAAITVSFIACGQLDQMLGKKDDKPAELTTEQKVKELEAKLKELESKSAAKSPAPASAAPSATSAAPSAPEAKPSRSSGYVRLYDDAGFTDRILTVSFGRDIGNMHYVKSDDGKDGFNDKASSVKYSVPAGWQAVLYENNNYAKRGYALKGSGSIPDLGYFGDKCSSIRWEKAGE